MIRLKSLAVLLVIWLVVACASFGPINTPVFEDTFRRDVPELQGPIVFGGPGAVLHGSNGFDGVFHLSVRTNSAPETHWVKSGVLVVAGSSLHLGEWRETRYLEVFRLDLKRVSSIEFLSLGLGRRVLLRLDGDTQFISLDAAKDDGQRIDAVRTLELCNVISKVTGRECVRQ
jgi:hypothetical protein